MQAFIRNILLSAILCFTGCATHTPVIPENQLDEAAETVLSEAVYFATLFNSCLKLGGEAEVNAIGVQQNWLAANWKLVAAADAYYSKKNAPAVFNYDGKSISPAAIRLAQKAHDKAIVELGLGPRSYDNKIKTCEFRLDLIKSNNINLNTHALIARADDELLKYLPSDITTIKPVPSLAGNIDTTLVPGRSYFGIIKKLQEHCMDAHTLIIDNKWPNEAYANFCENKVVEMLTCEWGKCESKTL